jgi:murein DD-endopeptidase MepM/ murein hydrolase activator NlpD
MLYSMKIMGRRKRQSPPRRRRAPRAAVALAVAAALLGALAVSPVAAGSTGAGAQAAIAVTGAGQTYGDVAVDAARTDDTVAATAGDLPAGLTLASGASSASSFIVDRTLVSKADVTATGISLLGGIVTADAMHLSATSSVLDGDAQATTGASTVTGLHVTGVDDAALPSTGGTVTVPGVGTLDVLKADSQAGGGDASATIYGLSLVLTAATDGLPAGATITVGALTTRADQASLDALSPTPTPTPTLTPTPTPTPIPTPTPTPTHTRTATPTPRPTAAAPSPTATATGSSYPATSYSAMPAPSTPSPAILGRFPGAVFPVVGTYSFTDTFGAYRADMPGGHEGDDIFATYGSVVVAVQDGTITGVSLTSIGGNNIHLTTSSGDYFYYAHLSRFATGLTQGQQVVAGQTIGYVGDTGDAKGTPPHLHFEIHPNGGAAVDPTIYLNAWRAAGHSVSTSPSAQTTAAAAPTAATDDPAIDAALQQAAEGFAALQNGITSGPRQSPGGSAPIGLAGAALLVANTAGALLIKRLHLGAVLLP